VVDGYNCDKCDLWESGGFMDVTVLISMCACHDGIVAIPLRPYSEDIMSQRHDDAASQ
jgi:hypothetical protein